jgi:hypothetical protein
MTKGRAIHPSLIAGHIAVAALALASLRVAPPVAVNPHAHQPGHPGLALNASPRRVSSPRRSSRSFAVTLID